jgi:hypothetical protein
MKREIEDYVKACTKCQINRPKKRAPMEIQTGQKVLLFGETVRRGRSKKLSPQYVGPYEVLAVDGVNVTIKKGRTTQKVHVNRVRPFH